MKRSIARALVIVLIAGAAIVAPIRTEKSEDPGEVAQIPAVEQEDTRAEKIDRFFQDRNMPLAGYGEKMIRESDKNELPDWRILAALAVRESSGGIHACGKNPFGWSSCARTFENWDEAIETVAAHIGGNVRSTRSLYGGKSTEEILMIYNPPSINPNYAAEVISIMDEIAPQ